MWESPVFESYRKFIILGASSVSSGVCISGRVIYERQDDIRKWEGHEEEKRYRRRGWSVEKGTDHTRILYHDSVFAFYTTEEEALWRNLVGEWQSKLYINKLFWQIKDAGEIMGWGSITLENHRSYFGSIWKRLACQWFQNNREQHNHLSWSFSHELSKIYSKLLN